jgi:hypothetical protein
VGFGIVFGVDSTPIPIPTPTPMKISIEQHS